MLDQYARQSRYSDPGPHAALLDDLPAELAAVVRNVVVHYRASGLTFPPERLAEIDGGRVFSRSGPARCPRRP